MLPSKRTRQTPRLRVVQSKKPKASPRTHRPRPATDLREEARRAQEGALREISCWLAGMPLKERFDRLRLSHVYLRLRKHGLDGAGLERLFPFVRPICSRHALLVGYVRPLERTIACRARSAYGHSAEAGLAEQTDRLVEELDQLCQKAASHCDDPDAVTYDRRLLAGVIPAFHFGRRPSTGCDP